MISFEEFKKILGAHGDQYTDEQIARIKAIEESLADIIIDHLLYQDAEAERVACCPAIEINIFIVENIIINN